MDAFFRHGGPRHAVQAEEQASQLRSRKGLLPRTNRKNTARQKGTGKQ